MKLRTILMVAICISASSADPAIGCTEVKDAYTALGYNATDVPTVPTAVDDLQICDIDRRTCCTREMEKNLALESRTTYKKKLSAITQDDRRRLTMATDKFHKFFTNLIDRSELDLDRMFRLAYGTQYESNSAVFRNFFDKMRQYYSGDPINLNEVVDQFFKEVFVKMFKLQNQQYEFDDTYTFCVQEKFTELKPFGQTPTTLKRNIKQAFDAARTFVQGLAVGRNVATKMASVDPEASCVDAHTKLFSCNYCQGHVKVKLCPRYCQSVLTDCLAAHTSLDNTWRTYADAMDELAERFEGDGAFNIEAVMSPLKDHISSAIMDYQTESGNIHQQIFSESVCGTPPSSTRTKRSTSALGISITPLRPKTAYRQVLSFLVTEFRSDLRYIRNIFDSMPTRMCTSDIFDSMDSRVCWNGQSFGDTWPPANQDGLPINVDSTDEPKTHSFFVRSQKEQLESMTQQLTKAKDGDTVEWLQLQMPVETSLPNTTIEQKSVKSRLPLYDVDGSGHIFPNLDQFDDDDEDGGSGFPHIPLPSYEGSASSSIYSSGSGYGDDEEENPTTVLEENHIQPIMIDLNPIKEEEFPYKVSNSEHQQTTPKANGQAVMPSFILLVISILLLAKV